MKGRNWYRFIIPSEEGDTYHVELAVWPSFKSSDDDYEIKEVYHTRMVIRVELGALGVFSRAVRWSACETEEEALCQMKQLVELMQASGLEAALLTAESLDFL